MIDRELFEQYRRALNTNADLVKQAVLSLNNNKALLSLSGTALQTELSNQYFALLYKYGWYAARVAVEFYKSMRADVSPAYEPLGYVPDNKELIYYDTKQAFINSKEFQDVITSLASTSQQRVMECADETLIRNAEIDPAKPRWALVPSATACGWCRMMASNGFVYGSKARANKARHPNCKCTPVVDFSDNPGVKGYNLDKLYDEAKSAYDEAQKTAWDEWMELSPEEQTRYKQKGRGAYDHFLRNKTVAIMNRNK